MGANVVELTDATFQSEVLDSSQPVLVDFWAPWCGPCRAIAPVIDQLAAENLGSVKVAKLNVDPPIGQGTAVQFGVESIPTLILFKNGEPVQRFVGRKSKAAL